MKNHKAKRRAQSEQRESPSGETYSHALISLFSLVTDVKNEIAELRKEQQTSRERMTSLHEQIARLNEYIDPNQVRSPSLSHSTTNSDGNGERSRQDNNRLYGVTGWPPYYVSDATKPMVYNGPLGPYMYNPSYSYVSSNVNTFDARHVEQTYFHSCLNSNAINSPPYIPQATRRPPSTYFTQSLPQAQTSPSRSSPKSGKSSPSRTESQQEEPHNDPASPVEQDLEHTLTEEEEENYTSSRRITRSSTKPNQQRVTTRRSSLGNTAKKRAPPKLPLPVLPPKRRARTVKSYRILSDSETEDTDESEQDPTEDINVDNKKENNKEKDDGKNKNNGKTPKASQYTPASDQRSKEKKGDNERNVNDQETESSEQGAHHLEQNNEDASTQEKEQENLPESDKLREDTQNTVAQEVPSSQKSSNTPTIDKPLLSVVIPEKHTPKRYGRQTVNPKTTLVDGGFFGIISMKQKNDNRSSSDISIDSRENLKSSKIPSIQSASQDEHAKDITHETVNDAQDIEHEETKIIKEQGIGIEEEPEAGTRNLKTKKSKQSSVNYDSDASGLSYLSATDNNTDTEADYNTYNLTTKDEHLSYEKMTRAKELEFELTPEEQLASEGLLTPLIQSPLDASKPTADAAVQKASLKKNNKKRVFEREVKSLGVEKKEIKKLGDYRERKLRPRFEKKRFRIY